MMQQAIEHGGYGCAVAQPFPQSSTGRFNAESGFMQSLDSNPAILNQVEGFPIRITGEAFSMAIN